MGDNDKPWPTNFIDVVFDGPPGPVAGRFVEVENPSGHSISVGEWVQRPDGYWVLRIPVDGFEAKLQELAALGVSVEATRAQFKLTLDRLELMRAAVAARGAKS